MFLLFTQYGIMKTWFIYISKFLCSVLLLFPFGFLLFWELLSIYRIGSQRVHIPLGVATAIELRPAAVHIRDFFLFSVFTIIFLYKHLFRFDIVLH